MFENVSDIEFVEEGGRYYMELRDAGNQVLDTCLIMNKERSFEISREEAFQIFELMKLSFEARDNQSDLQKIRNEQYLWRTVTPTLYQFYKAV